MENFNTFHDVFERLIELFARSQNALRSQFEGKYASFAADLIANCVPKNEMGQVIAKFQLYITIVIMNKIFKQEIMQAVIEVFDIFYQGNQGKPKDERLHDSEFYNDALNNDVDLQK